MDAVVGPLGPDDLNEADRIFRLAFGTFLGLPDPAAAFGDSDLVRTRWRAGHTTVLAARVNGTLVGSNVITRWGSLGWFGPMTVRPDLWDKGIAGALLRATVPVFDEWKVTHRGLFTFANSPKHVALYQKYGFAPRFLTAILEKPLPAPPPSAGPGEGHFSALDPAGAEDTLRAAREIASTALPGLDLTGEILAVRDQTIGETVLLRDEGRLDGFAVCHTGARSEAGSGRAYVKFAMVRPGAGASQRLAALLAQTESSAAAARATEIEVGVNSSHREAFRLLRDNGYRIDFLGVAMQSPDEPGYHRPEVTVLDDWR